MKKIVLNVNKFDKNFKTITKIEMRKTSSLSKQLYKKRCQAESTDESGGLSYKSRNKYISEENFS